MPAASEPAYWEAWARDLGWDPEKVSQAGEVGSMAVRRGMRPDQALEVVLARVRDGKNVPIGPGLVTRLTRNEGCLPFVTGVVLFLAVGAGPLRGVVIAFAFLVAAQIFFVVRGFTPRGWRLSLLGLALTVAAILVEVGLRFEPR